MTKMKRFIISMVVSAFALTAFSASTASAAECDPAGPFETPSVINDPGVAVPPFAYQVDAQSASLHSSWWLGDEAPKPLPIAPYGGPGNWMILIPAVPRDGTVGFLINGEHPSETGYCNAQVSRAISTPQVAVKTKKGKSKVMASFTQNRAVSTIMTVSQKVKKGKKRKLVTKSGAQLARKVRPGKVTVQLTVVAEDCSFGPTICTLHDQKYTLKAKKPKKKRKK